MHPSESALVDYVLANGVQSDPACATATLTPDGAWFLKFTSDVGPGGNRRKEYRNYIHRRYRTTDCDLIESELQFYRHRDVTCETGYSGETALPGCYLSTTRRIEGRRSYRACVAKGNPCDALTGDKHETVVDYRGVDGLRFERHFHSRTLDGTNKQGVGWTHSYRAKVIASGSTLTGLIRPDGYQDALQIVTSSPVPTYVTFDGSGTVVKKTSSTLWQVFNPDGSVESYNGSGVLQSIRDSQGRSTVLGYDADGRLVTVTAPFGQQLTLVYGPNGHLSEVIDPAGQVISYGYAAVDPNKPWELNLTSVSYPDGTSHVYHYEDSAFPQNLTGVSREDGVRFSTFAYDSTGRATLTEHAGGANRHTFAYSSTNTVVTDPLATTETVTFTTDSSLQRRLKTTTKAGKTITRTLPSAATDFQRRPTEVIRARAGTSPNFPTRNTACRRRPKPSELRVPGPLAIRI